MKRIKELLLSEKGIVIVNILLALGLLARNVFILFAAYILWFVFLLLNAKKADSKFTKILYGIIAIILGICIVRSAVQIIKLLPILLGIN